MEKINLAVLVGTTRVQRESIKAARLVLEVAKEYEEIEAVLVDPVDFNFPGDGNDPEGKDPRYTAITEKADAFFIVTPEYNHSIPGSLKRMFDSELQTYNHKAVAFAGVSDGPWGGVRAIEALNTVVRESGMVSSSIDVQFAYVKKLFDEQGKLLDDKPIRRIKRVMNELLWLAKAMKYARQNIPPIQ